MKFPLLPALVLSLTALGQPAPSFGAEGAKPLTIAIVGDSTVSVYAEANPTRGWGQMLPLFLDEQVKVDDLAIAGMSTKTFRPTGNWDKALAEHPDFVLIQFGHNDSHGHGKPEATEAAGDYTTNLERYVTEARAAGAIPILVTPMHRRTFDASGQLTTELLPYAEAMRGVAKKMNVPLIDLYAASGELFQSLGDTGSADLSASEKDRTHFNKKGATVMASLVAKQLGSCDPRLAPVVHPDKGGAAGTPN